MSDRSIQEQFLRETSEFVFGINSVFKPEYYDSGMKEPCDLVWYAGDCVVLIFCTSGRRSLLQKRKHNFSQLHKWMRHWKKGETLTNGAEISISFSDVKYIVGLSIVGGRDSASAIETEQMKFAESKGYGEKICALATISDHVFERLSRHCVSIRDFVFFLNFLYHSESVVHDWNSHEFLNLLESQFIQDMQDQLPELSISHAEIEQSWWQTKLKLRSQRKEIESRGQLARYQMVQDLSFFDMLWVSFSEAAMIKKIAPKGEFGHVVLSAEKQTANGRIICVVASSLQKISELGVHHFLENGAWTFMFVATLEQGREAPLRFLALASEIERWCLHDDMEFLRDKKCRVLGFSPA